MRPLPQIIKHVGRGARLAKDLDEGEAREAMTALVSGAADPVQVGAFLIAQRMKGESAAELAGFTVALRGFATLPLEGVLVDVDLHGDGRAGRPSLALAAACAAAACGARVLVRGAFGSRFAKNELGDAFARLGVDGAAPLATHQRALAAGVAVASLESYAPRVAALLDLREKLGVRTCVSSAVKLLDPAGAGRALVGIFHSPYHGPVGGACARLGMRRAAVVQAPGGTPLAPDKPTRVTFVEDAVAGEVLSLPSSAAPALPDGGDLAVLLEQVLRAPETAPAGAVRAAAATAQLMCWAAGVSDNSQVVKDTYEAIQSGAAASVLDQIVSCYRSWGF